MRFRRPFFLALGLACLAGTRAAAQVPLSGIYRGTSSGTLVAVGPPMTSSPTSSAFGFEIRHGAVAQTGTFVGGEVTVTISGSLAADGAFRYTIVNDYLFSVKQTTEYVGRLTIQPGGTTAVGTGTYTQQTVTAAGAPFSSISDGTWTGTAELNFPAGAGRLVNVSTRASVETADGILIAGLVIQGVQPKRIVLRAIGPSLAAFGVNNVLTNPTVRVIRDGVEIAANDDWAAAANAAEVTAAGLAPTDPRECALALTLTPGAYTALVSGVGGATGVALVEVYDLDANSDGARVSNLSTRATVRTGETVEIAGFAVRGGPRKVLVRGMGPSLTGVPGILANPTLTLFDGAGTMLATNNDWTAAANAGAIQTSGFAPGSPNEAALLLELPPANYTAILSGVAGGSGIGSVEIYEVP